MCNCVEEGCNTRASFNIPEESKLLYCKLHKKKNMINKNRKICNEHNCNKSPSYNYSIDNKPIYCNLHKKDNMINVISKRCIYDNCNKIPVYNYIGNKNGIYCNQHKLENMINIKDNICIEDNCKTRANYNYNKQKKGLYCKKHKKENMIDVKNKRCNHEDCITRPSYNYEHMETPLYCNIHKLEGMINIIDNKCIYEDCNKISTFNYDGLKTALYCATHKKENMIDIRSNLCIGEYCYTRVHNNKYEGYCLRCFVYLFPDMPNSLNYKTKEFSVIEYIKTTFNDKTLIFDKKIKDGCSKRRPDIFIDLGYQIIIIEVDENQHIDYDCSCENKRIMELSQDVGHRPIIFIRFNPDDYINNDNIKITSCWSIDKRGLCCIKRSKVKEWNERLNVLKDNINYWINNKTDKTVEIIQLYYNQNNIC